MCQCCSASFTFLGPSSLLFSHVMVNRSNANNQVVISRSPAIIKWCLAQPHADRDEGSRCKHSHVMLDNTTKLKLLSVKLVDHGGCDGTPLYVLSRAARY